MARRHSPRHPLFHQRWFADDIIITCVRWYLRFKLSYRDLAELARELGVSVAPSTILRWVIRYVPEFEKFWQAYERPVGDSWRVDETAVVTLTGLVSHTQKVRLHRRRRRASGHLFTQADFLGVVYSTAACYLRGSKTSVTIVSSSIPAPAALDCCAPDFGKPYIASIVRRMLTCVMPFPSAYASGLRPGLM
jgi:hypothetical protein